MISNKLSRKLLMIRLTALNVKMSEQRELAGVAWWGASGEVFGTTMSFKKEI